MSNLADKIAGIILAAGEGKRIGQNKGLLKINGISFLEKVILPLKNAGCDPVIVVGGSQSDKVKAESLKHGAEFALNEKWQSGQFSSLKAGLRQLKHDVEGAIIALADHPLVMSNTYNILMEEFLEHSDKIILPICNGRRGHPIVIPEEIIKEIKSAPDNSILKDIIFDHTDKIYETVIEDPGILKDIDTNSDLEGFRDL
jgi:molybdenum cofactor cytidylyltransferase